jgi:hypothetical protein
MAISLSRIIEQTKIIMQEHSECDRKCLGDRQLDLQQHTNHVAQIIAYYTLCEDR